MFIGEGTFIRVNMDLNHDHFHTIHLSGGIQAVQDVWLKGNGICYN